MSEYTHWKWTGCHTDFLSNVLEVLDHKFCNRTNETPLSAFVYISSLLINFLKIRKIGLSSLGMYTFKTVSGKMHYYGNF